MQPDPLLAALPDWAFAFAVVLARVGAAIMVMPGLGENDAPAVVRGNGAAYTGSALRIPGGTTGNVAMPGGDGVTYSPNSPLISATMPSNGARNTVRCVSAREAAMRASASLTWARDDSQVA